RVRRPLADGRPRAPGAEAHGLRGDGPQGGRGVLAVRAAGPRRGGPGRREGQGRAAEAPYPAGPRVLGPAGSARGRGDCQQPPHHAPDLLLPPGGVVPPQSPEPGSPLLFFFPPRRFLNPISGVAGSPRQLWRPPAELSRFRLSGTPRKPHLSGKNTFVLASKP